MNKLIKLRFLLPICNDFDRDIFFNLIQNLIGRAKLDEHYLDQSFKYGLSGNTVKIEQADVTDDWGLHTTKEDQIRQAFLLGYWAAKNFPVVGKKLHGLKWQPPERAAFGIDGLTTELSPDDVDAIIFKKMNIRLMELDVSQTTMQKLRLFAIDIPANINPINETQLTEKVKSFDVNDECLEECWKMLRQGWTGSILQFHSGPKRQPNNELPSFDTGSPPAKRLNLEHDAGAQNASTDTEISSPTNPMFLEVNTTTDYNGTSSRRKLCPDDPIRTCLLDIKSEIAQLSSFVHTTFSERENEGLNQHNILINRQADEIATLKLESKELRDSIGKLTKDYMAAQDGNEQKAALITALQKGIESTSKLQIQADRDLSASMDIIEVMKKDMAKLRAELEDHNSGNESTKLKLAKMRSENEKIQNEYQELTENYRKIFSERDSANRERQELTATKIELAKMCTENERIRNEYQKLSENCQEICTEREIANRERRELTAKNDEIESVMQDMSMLREENRTLLQQNQQLISDVNEFAATKLEMTKLSSENIQLKTENESLQKAFDTLSSETEIVIAELKNTLDETRSSPSTATTVKKSDADTQTDICTEVEMLSNQLGTVENIGSVDDQNFIFIISNGTETDDAITKEESAERGKDALSTQHYNNREETAADQSLSKLETEDVIVTECRDKLLKLKFGWATFQPTKTAKFSPVFVYPADPDGKERAQKVVASGYVSDEKNEFFEFGENVPDERKNKAGKTALKRLNERFKFSLV